jgi:hypothetical protein
MRPTSAAIDEIVAALSPRPVAKPDRVSMNADRASLGVSAGRRDAESQQSNWRRVE